MPGAEVTLHFIDSDRKLLSDGHGGFTAENLKPVPDLLGGNLRF